MMRFAIALWALLGFASSEAWAESPYVGDPNRAYNTFRELQRDKDERQRLRNARLADERIRATLSSLPPGASRAEVLERLIHELADVPGTGELMLQLRSLLLEEE